MLLPSDVVGVIAEYLPARILCQRPLMLVNKTWCQGVISQDAWGLKPTIHWPWIALSERDPHCPLHLYRGTDDDVTALVDAELVGPYTEAITLNYCEVSDSGVRMITKLRSLKALHLRNCGMTNDGLRNLALLPSLDALTLFSCNSLSGAGGLEDLLLSSQLVSLTIDSCLGIDDGILTAAADQRVLCQSLRALKLSTFNGTTATVGHLCKLNTLTSLTLQSCGTTNGDVKRLTTELKALSALSIADSRKITDAVIAHCAKMDHLTSLGFSGTKITDIGLQLIATSLHPSLTSLDISSCQLVTDDGMRHLATTPLKEKKTAASTTSSLKILKLGNTRITDRGMAADAISALGQLEQLDIKYCRGVSDDGIAHLVRLWPSLQSLDLSGCNFSEQALHDSLAKMKKLRELYVFGCGERITPEVCRFHGVAAKIHHSNGVMFM